MTLTQATTRTLAVPGATVSYDVRPGRSAEALPLFLIGSPMGAAGFATLASHFPAHDPDVRPAGGRAEPEGRSDEPVDAR